MSWVERDAAVVWHGFTQMGTYADNEPVIVERGEGRELIDVDGRRYLDAISSLWVNTLGHRVPELDQALHEQIDRIAHSTMLGNGNRVVIEFAEALAAVVPVDGPHMLFASDGASAVEQALKIAFQYWTNRGDRGRHTYLAFGDGYHGDTVGALSIGASGFGTHIFDPLRFPVHRAPSFADPSALATAAALIDVHRDELAAVVVEPLIQAAGGLHIAPAQDFATLADACRRTGVLLICDEVATGFGRTGTMFASDAVGLRPDLLCLGKGITGGYLPMSATIASQRVFDAFVGADLSEATLYHGHSYGGNALAAAVALRHLQLFHEWDVLANVRSRSMQLRDALARRVECRPVVREVRVCGLMAGVEIDEAFGGARLARRVCAAMVRRGVLSRSLGEIITLVPPLTITSIEIDRIVDVLVHALDDLGVRVSWIDWADDELDAIRAAGRWRQVRPLDGRGPEAVIDGRPVISFASNDYLGLTTHPAVVSAAHDALDRWGSGSGSARLIVGSRPIHHELEEALADWRHTERALLFPTGYGANLGVLSALGGPEVTVVSDELNHASIIDGCRLSRSRVVVYPHNDADACGRALATASGRRIVVTDTVFSMDGDVARVDDLVRLCSAHHALLIVDEAHAVLGPDLPVDLDGVSVLRVGTLSKTLGALGGFVAGPRALVELIINRSRPFIFTTAPTPADSAAGLAALAVCRSEEGAALRRRLRGHVNRVRAGHPSPIVPIMLGDEPAALEAAACLLAQGLLVPAIRPPTVPVGTCRLRVALSAAHTDAMVDRLIAALATIDVPGAEVRHS